jgi:hypothetical protein
VKYSIKQIKNLNPSKLLRLIELAKKHLKENEVVQEMFKERDLDISYIDYVPTTFGDIDVSATTNKGIVILNYKLLCDGNFFKNYSYLVHEYLHWMQQLFNDKPTKSSNSGDYLKNKYEMEAFQFQIKYIEDQFGTMKAEDYVDHLLDYHDKKGKERKVLEDKLENRI